MLIWIWKSMNNKVSKKGYTVIFDIDTEDLEADPIGMVIPYKGEYDSQYSKIKAGDPVDPVITDDEYGHLLTALAPVKNSKGETVCYAFADVDVELLIQNKKDFLVKIITVYFNFFILLISSKKVNMSWTKISY